ncbi:hypothetical protein [Microbacterium rhizosphaerae]|uniref:Uncharacterized protein n=1 Tax=Microbacterium rhizosphaerae TaxID=1678237 RepID=A0ABZ0SK61_9MICO|nr:hypothetical protein [Microbacterium rhizosphaerae]WPR89289.1 hypothetical protein SM116_16230 [Microbacterium rhizosphaerae]
MRCTVAWVAAGALSVAGVVTLALGLATPVSFGWFAYQPLADATFTPTGTGVVVSRATVIGFVLLTIGLVGLAFLGGLRAGKRRP